MRGGWAVGLSVCVLACALAVLCHEEQDQLLPARDCIHMCMSTPQHSLSLWLAAPTNNRPMSFLPLSPPALPTHPHTPQQDPNAPKKPMGAYFLFQNEMRSKVKDENPDMKVTDVSKHIGELWKGMSDKEKEK